MSDLKIVCACGKEISEEEKKKIVVEVVDDLKRIIEEVGDIRQQVLVDEFEKKYKVKV